MKILQIISSYPPAYSYGGALYVAYNLSKKLAEIGHEITVYTTDVLDNRNRYTIIKNPEMNEGVTIYRFKNVSNLITSLFHISCAPGIILKLRKNIKNFDIIHCHEFRSFEAVVMHHYSKKYNVPYILQAHGSVLPILEKERFKKAFDWLWGIDILQDAKKLIAVSNIEKRQYEKMQVPENKIVIIPNGINITEYEMLPERGGFKKKYGISSNVQLILYLGRLHKSKGLVFLINGFSNLLELTEDVKLVIVGPDDGILNHLKNLVKRKKIEEYVIFTGPLYENQKIEALVDADVLVYPGMIEIFGLVPFEALLCGTPVIVSEDCGCGEIIKGAKCGSVIKYGDVEKLKENILLLLNSESHSKSLVESGQIFIQNTLSWPCIIEHLEQLYKEQISKTLMR